jgi:tetratricopeptide (TPR) repeat protein
MKAESSTVIRIATASAGVACGAGRIAGFILLLAVAMQIRVGAQENELWRTDADVAAKEAASTGRDMLLLFTGSDWCPPCKLLEERILSQPVFADGVRDKFTLLKFDFPQEKELPADLVKQNQEWADKFGVEAFPTLILVDKELRPFAITGFRDEPPAEFVEQLVAMQTSRVTRDEFLSKAAAATGLERAKLLDQALSAMKSSIVETWYQDVLDQIDVLDPNDETGLREKYFAQRDRERWESIMSSIAMVARLQEPEQAVSFIDQAIADGRLPLEMWLHAQNTKVKLLRGINKVEEANKLIDEMVLAEGLDDEQRQRLITNKAWYLTSLGRGEDAIRYLEEQILAIPVNLLLVIGVGDVCDSLGKSAEAIAAYDRALLASAGNPEALLEVSQAKADLEAQLNKVDDAIKTLDRVSEDANLPAGIRAHALLHKSMILRPAGRRRLAILAENRALEIVEPGKERAEIQKLVDKLHRKFEAVGETGD